MVEEVVEGKRRGGEGAVEKWALGRVWVKERRGKVRRETVEERWRENERRGIEGVGEERGEGREQWKEDWEERGA